jgi:plastocyanin
MRTAQLLPPALLIALLVPAPSLAADAGVSVSDDFFSPSTPVQIQPGETVTWTWTGSDDHDVASNAGQIDHFKSKIQSGAGKTFAHTFNRPGRYRYICEIHPFSMKATVVVGTPDSVKPVVTRAKARRSGRRVKASFKLSELSVVKVTLKRGSRTVKKASKTLAAGSRSITIKSSKRLRAGLYTTVIQATDGFGNRSKQVKARFRVR